MLNNYIQTIDDSFSLTTHFWKDVSKDIAGLYGIPASLTLPGSNWNQMEPFEEVVGVYYSQTDISPDKKRIFVSYDITDPETYELETHIDVFKINGVSLEKEAQFKFKDLSIKMEDGSEPGDISNYRDACFMGNHHIAIALATGTLRILSIKNNRIFLEKKIGGRVIDLACSKSFIAASLFPGITEKLYHACGVKVYEIDQIIKEKRLDPCTIIPAHSFSILPHTIRFDRMGTTLLCKGSKIVKKGYVNYIETYNLNSKTLTTIVDEKDENKNHQISNFSEEKEYCRFSKQGFWVNNQFHEKIWQPKLPEALVEYTPECKLSTDGSQIIACRYGVLYHVQKGKSKNTCISNLGYVAWAHFLSDSLIIVGTSGSYHFDIKIIDTNDFNVQSSLSNSGKLEWVNRDGFDITGKGILLIADSNGIVRKLKNNLIDDSVIHHHYGPLRQVKADPFKYQDALLSESGAIIMVDTEKCTTKLRIGYITGKPVAPGSDKRSIDFSWDIDDKVQNLWMAKNTRNKDIQFGVNRLLSLTKYDLSLEFSDYIDKKIVNLYATQLGYPVCDALRIKDQAFVLLQNGSIIKVDPFYIHDAHGSSKNKERFPAIIKTIDSPRGFTKISDNKIIVWTKNSLIYYELSDELKILQTKTKKISGIYDIKWDAFNNRMVIAFAKYLSFWSLDLKEMYRLYLVSGKGHLIHVPFPAHLKTSFNSGHPGYYWSNVNRFDLFEVKTIDREIVTDQNMKEQFIGQYFNRFMVEMAVDNYDAYCTCLGDNNYNISRKSHQFLLETM
ncbi:MAG: hypothetical protein KAR45_02265 [Desulfobacteraceae bacterium]|nr:hypothetical protein [Desulfobacteraceae bacterium]